MKRYIKIKCDECGKEKEILYSEFKRNSHHFCSRECLYKHQKKSVTKKCETCGKSIEVRQSRLLHSQHYFCNDSCHRKYRPKSVTVHCSNCGTKLERHICQLSKTGRYFCKKCCYLINKHRVCSEEEKTLRSRIARVRAGHNLETCDCYKCKKDRGEEIIFPLCDCGCGKQVSFNKRTGKMNNFIRYHNNPRKNLTPEQMREIGIRTGFKKGVKSVCGPGHPNWKGFQKGNPYRVDSKRAKEIGFQKGHPKLLTPEQDEIRKIKAYEGLLAKQPSYWNGVRFLSGEECEAAKLVLTEPISGYNCHIPINGCHIDLFPQMTDKYYIGCLLEYHPRNKGRDPRTTEKYTKDRTDLKNNSDYADFPLVVFTSLSELKDDIR